MSNNSAKTKNDSAWEKLFDKYNIKEKIEHAGSFTITANQIKEFREPRLMTKFDHKINLPKLFSQNRLAILPISRGSYIISHFDAYKELEKPSHNITHFSFPDYLQSIDYENITSEAIAINCAYVSGILADFIEDEELLPTVSGRMSSDSFSFQIHNIATKSNVPIDVNNSQIEIDSGFEGIRQLSIIEAKNYLSDDFLIRQLYYPYKLWINKIHKDVTPIFLVYSNGIFHLYMYEFQDPSNYNSLVLIKQKNYSVESEDITLDNILEVLNTTTIINEPNIPFPQADSFNRLVNLCELLYQADMTKEDITINYAFAPRQTDYYTSAGRYLGLIERYRENNQTFFSLTAKGQTIMRLKYKLRQLALTELILKHKAFNDTLKLYLEQYERPSKEQVIQIMQNCHLYNVNSNTTIERRASTIIGWIDWILELQS